MRKPSNFLHIRQFGARVFQALRATLRTCAWRCWPLSEQEGIGNLSREGRALQPQRRSCCHHHHILFALNLHGAPAHSPSAAIDSYSTYLHLAMANATQSRNIVFVRAARPDKARDPRDFR